MGWKVVEGNPFAEDELSFEDLVKKREEPKPQPVLGAASAVTEQDYNPFAAFGQTVESPASIFQKPTAKRPEGMAALADPQQYKEVAKGVPSGAVSFVGTALQGAGAIPAAAQSNIQKNAQMRINVLDRLDRGEDLRPRGFGGLAAGVADPESDAISFYRNFSPEQRAAERQKLQGQLSTYRPTPLAEQPLYKAGGSVQAFGKTLLPAAPGYEDAFGRQVGEGLGSLIAGLPFGVAGRIPGAIFFGAGGMGEAGTRAIAYDQAEKRAGRPGLTQDQINTASLYGVGPGTTDMLPVEALLGRLHVPVPGRKALAQAIGRIGGQAFIEGMQEGGQQFLQNLIAQGVYKPDQALGEQVRENAEVGGAVGAAAEAAKEAGGSLWQRLLGRRGHVPGTRPDAGTGANDPFAQPLTPVPGGEGVVPAPAEPIDVTFEDLIPPERRIAPLQEGPVPQAGLEPPPLPSPAPQAAPQVLPAAQAVEAAPVPPALRQSVMAETLRQAQAMPQVAGLLQAEQQRTGETAEQVFDRLVASGPVAQQFAQTAANLAMTGQASRAAQPLAQALGQELAKPVGMREQFGGDTNALSLRVAPSAQTEAMETPESLPMPSGSFSTQDVLGNMAPSGRRGVDVLQFIRSKGGLKPSRELSQLDARRYPGLINRNGLSADQMREAMVEAGYLQDSGPDEPAVTTPADVYDLLSRSISGERIVPQADRAADDAFSAARSQRNERRELQAAERNFVQPEIARYDAEIGDGNQLWRAYLELSAPDRNDVIDRNRRGEDIVDLLEEKTLQNPIYYALGAPISRVKASRDALGYTSKAVDAANALQRKSGASAGFLNDLTKAGVTKNELQATGLDRFLAERPTVTKQEIVEFLERNRVSLQETRYGGLDPNDLPHDMLEELREEEVNSLMGEGAGDGSYSVWFDEDEGRWTYGLYGEPSHEYGGGQVLFDSEEDARTELREMLESEVRNTPDRDLLERHRPELARQAADAEGGAAKWREYSLDPDNPTYRESVISIPERTKARDAHDAEERRLNRKYWDERRVHWSVAATPEERAEMDRLQGEMLKENEQNVKESYKSGHWDQRNIVAHARTQILTDIQGRKAFNIDELQSDWGQNLREKGGIDPEKVKLLEDKWSDAVERQVRAKANASALLLANPDATTPRFDAPRGYGELDMGSPNPRGQAMWEGRTLVEGVMQTPFNLGSLKGKITYWPQTFNWRGEPTGEKYVLGTDDGQIQNATYESMEAAKQGIASWLRSFPLRRRLEMAEYKARAVDEGPQRADQFRKAAEEMGIAAEAERLASAELNTAKSAAPSHPLVNTTDQWVTTVMRRLIQQAADSGADGISITPAKVQNERFSLTTQGIQGLAYAPREGYLAMRRLRDGARKTEWEPVKDNVKPEELPGIVGREVAEQLLQQPLSEDPRNGFRQAHVLNNLDDLEIGGEGMKATYDGLYPSILGKLLRKLDPSIKAETVQLKKHGSNVPHGTELDWQNKRKGTPTDFTYFPLTEKAKQKLADEGQVMFALGAGAGGKPKLAALHNLSEENLAFADDLGGIALPSIGVVKEGMGLEGFGEITLIGRKDLADPKKNPVFDSDAYTARFPEPTYKKVTMGKAQPLIDRLRKYADLTRDYNTSDRIWDRMVNYPNPKEVVEAASNGAATMAAFLDSQGIALPQMQQDAPQMRFSDARYANKAALRQVMESDPRLASQFRAWIDRTFISQFGEPTLKVGGRNAPYTLDNIVKVMKGRGVRGREEATFFTEGAARAGMAQRFSSLTRMREAAESGVLSRAETEKAQEITSKLMEEFRAAVAPYYPKGRNIFDPLDAAMRAVSSASAYGTPTVDGLRRALEREEFTGVPDTVINEGLLAINAFRAAPVPYFESKPQRAVDLSEFAGAVIPANASQETREILERHGLPVREYTDTGREAQSQAAAAFAKELAEKGDSTLFALGGPRDVTQTPEFKRWFGDSKVVDENGDPLVVYHGSGAPLEAFDIAKAGGGTDAGILGRGFYFSDNQGIARFYRKAGGELYDVYLNIENPLVVDGSYFDTAEEQRDFLGRDDVPSFYTKLIDLLNKFQSDHPEASLSDYGLENALNDFAYGEDAGRDIASAITDMLQVYGYDGIVFKFPGKIAGTEYVAFDPRQIKSASGNRGSFDANDDRITYATGRSAAEVKRHIGAFVKMGRAIAVPFADSTLQAAKPYSASIPSNAEVAALSRVEPMKGGMVRAVFKTSAGDTVTGLEAPWETIASIRAFFRPGNQGAQGRIFLIRFAESSGPSPRLGGEIRHESIHALRRNGALPGEVWARLLGHAKKLRILESDLRTYLQAIDDPDYRHVEPGLTIIDEYLHSYKGLPDLLERIDQEYVAHMAELYSHGQLLPQELGDVQADLDDIFSGKYSTVRGGRPVSLAASAAPQSAFAGPWAQTAKQNPLILAQKLTEQGVDPETIWKRTGWFQGADDRWRFEIDDSLASIKFDDKIISGGVGNFRTTLGAFLDHPALFKAYPFLRGLPVFLTTHMIPGEAGHKGVSDGESREGMPPAWVTVGVKGYEPQDRQRVLSALLHEVQHDIQDIENFAAGGNMQGYASGFMNRLFDGQLTEFDQRLIQSDTVRSDYRNWMTFAKNAAQQPDDQDLRDGLTYFTNRLSQSVAFEAYQRLAGEVEAREVQNRLEMTPAERRGEFPAPVGKDEQRVKMSWSDARYADDMLALAGPRAAGAPKGAMATAERREAQGRTPDQIWQELGVTRGPETKWRWEIDDSAAKIIGLDKVFNKPSPGIMQRLFGRNAKTGKVKTAINVPLLNVLQHPKLYTAYPFLRQMRVDLAYGPGVTPGGSLRTRDTASGGKVYRPIKASASSPEELKTVLLHEIQHYIQNREGFATGSDMTGRPDYQRPRVAEEAQATALYDPARDDRKSERFAGLTPGILSPTHAEGLAVDIMDLFEKLDAAKANGVSGEDISELEGKLLARGRLLEDAMLVRPEDYIRSAGEAEAREVESRIDMTPAERRATRPLADLPQDAIVSRDTQTRDYRKAYDTIMDRAKIWKQISDRWKMAEDIGAGVSVVRPSENSLTYAKSPKTPLVDFQLYPEVGSATPMMDFHPAFAELPFAKQKQAMDAILRDLRARNLRPAIDQASDESFTFWARYDPRLVAFDPRLYAKEVEALAKAQHGEDATVSYDDYYGEYAVTSPEMKLEAERAAIEAGKVDKQIGQFLQQLRKKYGDDYHERKTPEEAARLDDLRYKLQELMREADRGSVPFDDTAIFEGRTTHWRGSDMPVGVDPDIYKDLIIDEQLDRWGKLPRPGDDVDFSDLLPA